LKALNDWDVQPAGTMQLVVLTGAIQKTAEKIDGLDFLEKF
jgi:hypothetical protein